MGCCASLLGRIPESICRCRSPPPSIFLNSRSKHFGSARPRCGMRGQRTRECRRPASAPPLLLPLTTSSSLHHRTRSGSNRHTGCGETSRKCTLYVELIGVTAVAKLHISHQCLSLCPIPAIPTEASMVVLRGRLHVATTAQA